MTNTPHPPPPVANFTITAQTTRPGEPAHWTATSTSEPWLTGSFPTEDAAREWALDTNDRLAFGDLPRRVVDKNNPITKDAAQWILQQVPELDPDGTYQQIAQWNNLYVTMDEVFTDATEHPTGQAERIIPAGQVVPTRNPAITLALDTAWAVSHAISSSEHTNQGSFNAYLTAATALELDGPLQHAVELLRACAQEHTNATTATLHAAYAYSELERAEAEGRTQPQPHYSALEDTAQEALRNATALYAQATSNLSQLHAHTQRTIPHALATTAAPKRATTVTTHTRRDTHTQDTSNTNSITP